MGHISAECLAKHYDNSMNARFPPKERKPPKPLRQYDCRRCGQRHPFNVYCPFITQPPVVPGECKSCGAVTNVHDDDCQYVEVKDEIGICSFCGQLDHTYAQCPEREEQREIAQMEREKDKMDKEKAKAKMKIVSGILTRQKDSDKVTPSETFNLPFIKPLVELACSFCGNSTHGHAEGPVLHQYIRQQANELAAARASGHYPTPIIPLGSRGDKQPKIPNQEMTPGPQEKPLKRGKSFLCRGKIISPEIEKIHRQRGGGNNLVYLLGGEVDHPREVEGGVPQMMEVGMMVKLGKKKGMRQMKTLSP